MSNDDMVGIMVLAAIGLFVAAVIWLGFFAPCGFYRFEKASDIPARCLSHYTK